LLDSLLQEMAVAEVVEVQTDTGVRKKKKSKLTHSEPLAVIHSTDSNINEHIHLEEPRVKRKKEKKSKKEKLEDSLNINEQNSSKESPVKRKKDNKSKKEKQDDSLNINEKVKIKKDKKSKIENPDSTDSIESIKEKQDDSSKSIEKKKKFFRDKPNKTVTCTDTPVTASDSKFSIKLNVNGDGDGGAVDLPVFKQPGKGPKIIIAKDTANEAKQSDVKLSKRKRKHMASNSNEVDDSVHESKGMGKALKYLKTWSEDRDSWKFEKCRQIWLLHNAFDEGKVCEKVFPSLLKYTESVKGAMREKTRSIAQEKVDKAEKWEKMLSEDHMEEEILKELGTKVSEVVLKRAECIVDVLSP